VEPFAAYDVCHLYATEPSVADRVVRELGLKAAGEGAGNVVFLRPYYRDSFCTGRAGSEGSMSDLQL
jgi:hypothetical protein